MRPLEWVDPAAHEYLLWAAKRCPCCGRTLPGNGDFYSRDRSAHDGLKATCRMCVSVRDRERYRARRARAVTP